MPYPNLIIIGPPKCGTTSIFDWLSKHPDTCPSKVKETNYFHDRVMKSNQKANFLEYGLREYENLFPRSKGQSVVFESSPGYLCSKVALKEFAKFDPKPFILFIYRNPAERLYSEFRFSKFKTQNFQSDFADFCGEYLSESKVEEGKIVTHINRWIRNYDREKVLIFHFDDLKRDVFGFMKSLCQKVGLDAEFYMDFKFDAKNTTVVRRSKRLHTIVDRFYKFFPDWSRNIIVPIYRRLNQSSLPDPTPEETKLIKRLREYYKDETWENIQV